MSKKKTKNEIIADFRKVHGNRYNYSEVDYKNYNTKVRIICPIHGAFEQTPHNHLKGQGCPECGKEYAKEHGKHDYIHFIKVATKKYGNKFSYPFIEKEYENTRSRITIRCNECGETFIRVASSHLSSKDSGCKRCLRKEQSLSFSYDDLLNKNPLNIKLRPFEGRLSKEDKCIAICDSHGEYEVSVEALIRGKGKCGRCARADNKRVISVDTFKKKLGDKFKDIRCNYEEFVNMGVPITFTCVKCGHIFKRRPSDMLSHIYRRPCPHCSKEISIWERTKTTESFKKEVEALYGVGAFDLTNTVYTSSSDYVTLKCNKCKRYFTKEANSLLQGHGCPYHFTNHSKGEEEIKDYLVSLGETVNTCDRIILRGHHELDIYLPDRNLAIEYDGIYWHNELNKPKDYHLNKTIECEKKGIHLFHIFEDEWIYKKEIIKSMLNFRLGKEINRIFARKCRIDIVSAPESRDFLDKNHLQGYCNSTYRYGLYYNNELVSLMTFGKTRHFIGNSSHEYELLRFCNKLNTATIGGASRLFKYFIKTHNPISVVSYADRRWSTGNLYEKLGFTLYNVSKPNYYYITDGIQRRNRFNFRKSILRKKYDCPEKMSEHEFCLNKGWYRIYDCGCLCYEWERN